LLIQWVNHAGFLLRHGTTCVSVDPWLEGLVFDESWSQLAQSCFTYRDFENVNFIWFSHEHPDHFCPPNLKQILQEYRSKITVLFRYTADKRVVNLCRQLGFGRVIELSDEWYGIGSEGADLEILCNSVGRGDSWACFKTPEHRLLDLNDCIYLTCGELEPLQKKVGQVDVLLTQFSYASWWGNVTQPALWEAAANAQLAKIEREVKVLQPQFVVLAASLVYYCHKENWYMNQWVNKIEQAYDFVSRLGVTAIVLYPGEQWKVGSWRDSSSALRRYEEDFSRAISGGPLRAGMLVPIARLQTSAREFMKRIKARNSRLLLWRIPGARILLTDYNQAFRLSLPGLRRTGDNARKPDIELSSSALLYCFDHDWGGETLMINGRFSVPVGADKSRFFRWFDVARANSHGDMYDVRYYYAKVKLAYRKLCRRSSKPASARA
jgi:hypothetical protein